MNFPTKYQNMAWKSMLLAVVEVDVWYHCRKPILLVVLDQNFERASGFYQALFVVVDVNGAIFEFFIARQPLFGYYACTIYNYI